MMPKVLIADDLQLECSKILRENGIEVVEQPKVAQEDLPNAVRGLDGVIVRSRVKITSHVITAGTDLKIIGRAGIGVDNIDVETATQKGIVVVNAPLGNVTAAAEHAFALIMACARNIVKADNWVKAGRWERSKLTGIELEGKTLGIVGLGKVGSLVARYAKSFSMKVVTHDPYISQEKAADLGVELRSFDELLKQSDIITIHVPYSEKTHRLFTKGQFEQMKPTARLINTSRGSVVDEKDLYDALVSKKIAGACLDVFENEPVSKDNPLLGLDNVILTPHLGASTQEAQLKVAVDIANEFVEFFKNGNARNAVNISGVKDPALEPFMRLCLDLGSIGSQITDGRVNRLEACYFGEISNHDVAALTRACVNGVLKPVCEESVNLVNTMYHAKQRGIIVTESKSSKQQIYRNLVVLKIQTDQKTRTLSGTIFEGKEPRIVKIDDYNIDLEPQNHMIFMSYPDVPGVVGKFGTVLGRNNINIADMAVGRIARGKQAVIIVTVDDTVGREVIDQLKEAISGIEEIKVIKL